MVGKFKSGKKGELYRRCLATSPIDTISGTMRYLDWLKHEVDRVNRINPSRAAVVVIEKRKNGTFCHAEACLYEPVFTKR
jgi:hypothetical protein